MYLRNTGDNWKICISFPLLKLPGAPSVWRSTSSACEPAASAEKFLFISHTQITKLSTCATDKQVQAQCRSNETGAVRAEH